MSLSFLQKPTDFLQLLIDAHELASEQEEHKKASAFDDTVEVGKTVEDWKVGKRGICLFSGPQIGIEQRS